MALSLLIVALIAAFFFALGIVLTPFGLRAAPPLVGASISVPSSAVFFLLLAPFTLDLGNADSGAILLFALAGVIYPAMVTLLNFAGNLRLGANLAGALGNLTPLFAVGFAVLLLGDIPHPSQLIGVLAVCAGLVIMALDRVRSHPGGALWILLLPLAAALFRGLADWPNAFAASTVSYVVSASMLLLVRRTMVRAPVPRTRGMLWFCVIGISNGLALLFLYTALTMGPVTTVAPVVATYPLMIVVLNRAIHGDRTLSRAAFAGIAISVIGVVLVLTA
jgi:drug/metabolite transporter (DMT)-like permease